MISSGLGWIVGVYVTQPIRVGIRPQHLSRRLPDDLDQIRP
jgi:hypothetical protein